MINMKKSFLILLFLLCVFKFNNVYASECTSKDISTLKALAEKIEFSKKLIEGEDNQGTAFELVGHNLNSNLLLKFPNGMKFVPTKSEEEIMSLLDGYNIKVEVYASEKHICDSIYITTLDISLPVYNKYYNREECKGKESADICKQWYDTDDISEEEFLKLVKEAKVTNPPIERTNWFLSFLKNNWIVISASVLITLFIVGGVLFVRKQKRVKIDI